MREFQTAYEDARHSLLHILDAPSGPKDTASRLLDYNRLLVLVNGFRDSYGAYRDVLREGSTTHMDLQSDYASIHTRAAQKLLDLSPFDLPPEE